jgi:hypothetical protein
MMIASFQHGLAAGMMSAVLVLGAGSAALAQAGRSTAQQPGRANAGKAAPAKPVPAKPAPATSARPSPAAAKPAPAQAATGPGGAALVATFNDWGVYTAQTGRSKICYALSQPKDRLPKNLSRDPAYLFVSFRPAENVRNEVALVLGFAARENGPAEAAIGSASYALLTKASNAWLKNPAEEGQAIGTMARASSVTVKAQSARGNQLTDRYSLSGFGQALERARKECGA